MRAFLHAWGPAESWRAQVLECHRDSEGVLGVSFEEQRGRTVIFRQNMQVNHRVDTEYTKWECMLRIRWTGFWALVQQSELRAAILLDSELPCITSSLLAYFIDRHCRGRTDVIFCLDYIANIVSTRHCGAIMIKQQNVVIIYVAVSNDFSCSPE